MLITNTTCHSIQFIGFGSGGLRLAYGVLLDGVFHGTLCCWRFPWYGVLLVFSMVRSVAGVFHGTVCCWRFPSYEYAVLLVFFSWYGVLLAFFMVRSVAGVFFSMVRSVAGVFHGTECCWRFPWYGVLLALSMVRVQYVAHWRPIMTPCVRPQTSEQPWKMPATHRMQIEKPVDETIMRGMRKASTTQPCTDDIQCLLAPNRGSGL